jgi:hypothetical protein
MKVVFNPALESTTTVPSAVLARSQCVTFTATVSGADYHSQIKKGGARIEVWSDIPAGGKQGAWGSVAFEAVPDVARAESPSSLLDTTLSLISATPAQATTDNVTLQARFVVPNASVDKPRYGFTYRIVYPSGHIQWLGSHGRNGTLIPGEPSPVGWLPNAGWQPGSEEGTALWKGDEGVLGRLGKSWSGWAMTESGPVRFTTLDSLTTPASLIILFPNPAADSLVFHLPVYLHTSGRCALDVNADCEVVLHGQEEVQIHLLTDPEALKTLIGEHNRPSHWRIHPANDFIFMSPLTNNLFHVLPISPSLATSTVVQAPNGLLPTPEGVVVYSSACHTAKVDPSAFIIGRTGGEFTVTPSIPLEDDTRKWIVSVLSPGASLALPPAILPPLPPKPIFVPPVIEPETVPVPDETPKEAVIEQPKVEHDDDDDTVVAPSPVPSPAPPPLQITTTPKKDVKLPGFLLLLLRAAALIASIILRYILFSRFPASRHTASSPDASPLTPMTTCSASAVVDHDREESLVSEENASDTEPSRPTEEVEKHPDVDPPHYEEKIDAPLVNPLTFKLVDTNKDKISLFLQASAGSRLIADVAVRMGNQMVEPLGLNQLDAGSWLVEVTPVEHSDILQIGLVA